MKSLVRLRRLGPQLLFLSQASMAHLEAQEAHGLSTRAGQA